MTGIDRSVGPSPPARSGSAPSQSAAGEAITPAANDRAGFNALAADCDLGVAAAVTLAFSALRRRVVRAISSPSPTTTDRTALTSAPCLDQHHPGRRDRWCGSRTPARGWRVPRLRLRSQPGRTATDHHEGEQPFALGSIGSVSARSNAIESAALCMVASSMVLSPGANDAHSS